MAAPKKGASTPKSRASARVTSRAKGAARASASKTSAKQERAAVGRSLAKPAKVQESGAGWGNVARYGLQAAARLGDVKRRTPGKPSESRPMMTTVTGRKVSSNASNRAMDAAARDLKKGNVKGAQKNIDRAAGRLGYGRGKTGKK